MTAEDRRRAQEALHRLGYYSGPISGAFGPLTRAAIRSFQHNIGAQPTGHLNADEADRLARSP
jgi:peptidoglycan hydrolase-like protein with peptidoglycan-binding domain